MPSETHSCTRGICVQGDVCEVHKYEATMLTEITILSCILIDKIVVIL